ncbi:hypothetical protein FA95DRAFT_1558067 [Auriscalpium vulgare]|uniref:Uncharacterized protein n=1 Tax=Auriscalpium vulgare TaxID=40419 RepID=A0ACB8RWC9_9AGAM|nr:hypothetical protein FA95DRAFT_1558067 [Auriscalpium vulgare]
MDRQEVPHSLAKSGPTSTTEAWLSTLRSQFSRIDSSSADSLAALRNERAAIASVLSIVDSRINGSAAPIFCLPPELLVRIFSYFANRVLSEGVQSMDHVPPAAPWVRLTWVCRRWRQVMLTNPTLWRDVVLPLPPQWARAMLARSQNQPLSVFYSDELKAHARSPAWVLPFHTLEQVRSIHIHSISRDILDKALSQLLSTPAPILEDASFCCMSSHLPRAALFANSAPRLRNLLIHDTLLTRDSQVFPLSCFLPHIVSLNIRGRVKASLPEFIAALQRLKQIETLVLVGCLRRFSSAPHSPAASQIARLTSLKSLNIGSMVTECVGFLRHVQTPDTARLRIEAFTSGGVDAFAPLYPFLAPAGGYRSNPFRNMGFLSCEPGHLTFSACHNLDADHAPCDREVIFYWDRLGDTVFSFMSTLCAEVTVHHLLRLMLNFNHRRGLKSPEEWLEMLGAATELQTLHVAGEGATLCQTLSASILEDGKYSREVEGNPVWPKLQVLKLDNQDLSFCYKDAEENWWADCIGMRVDEVLLRELEHRHQRGAALNTLQLPITSCDVDPEWLQDVERVVDRVLVQ